MRTLLGTVAAAGLAAIMLAPAGAQAFAITATSDLGTLSNALFAPSSGMTLSSATLLGAPSQQGTFTGFNLAPSSGNGPTISIADGVALSTGNAAVAMTNTSNETSVATGTGSYAPLSTLAGASTNDSNALQYEFTVAAGLTALSMQFIFGTEEFPTQTVTDIFGFFVDGVNYAKFANGDLISNTPNNPTNFIDNSFGNSKYGIEYNGLTQLFTVTGLLNPNLTTHTVWIAVADTTDTLYDSGIFASGLKAVTADGGGITPGGPGTGGPTPVPEPASMALFGVGLLGLGALRARRRA